MRLGCAYYGQYFETHMRTDLEEMKKAGCDDVVITISENDMKYFPGKFEFAPKICKELGLRLFAVPWGFGNLFGGGRMSNFILDYPEVMQVNDKGKLVGAGCYNNKKFRDRYKEFIKIFDEHGYDGILIDEPTPIDCYCNSCKKKFKEYYNSELRPDLPTKKIENFRKDCVVDFTKDIANYVKLETGLISQVAMMPVDLDMWERISNINSIDIFGVDPYWLLKGREQPFKWFVDLSRKGIELCNKINKQSLVWINCWNIPAGKEEEIFHGVIEAAKLAPDMIYVWAFRGALGTNESSDNPSKAWEQLLKGFKQINK